MIRLDLTCWGVSSLLAHLWRQILTNFHKRHTKTLHLFHKKQKVWQYQITSQKNYRKLSTSVPKKKIYFQPWCKDKWPQIDMKKSSTSKTAIYFKHVPDSGLMGNFNFQQLQIFCCRQNCKEKVTVTDHLVRNLPFRHLPLCTFLPGSIDLHDGSKC